MTLADGCSIPHMRTVARTCPLCEATCGLEVTLDDDRVVRCAATPRTSSPTGSSARRAARCGALHHDPDRLRTPLVARDGELRRGDVGRGVRRDRPAPAADARAPRPRRASPSTPATRPRTTSRRCSTAASSQGARARATSSARSTVDQMPKHVSAGLHVRRRADDPGARPRPHDAPARARREPAGLQRLADDRARRARAAARRSASAAARSSSSTRAARARPSTPTSTTSSARARTRCCCSRSCTCCSRRASRRRPSTSTGVDGRERSPQPFTPEAVAGGDGHPAPTRSAAWRASSPPPSAPPSTAASARRPQAFGTLASWLVDVLNALTGNLDRAGRRDVPARRRRADQRRARRRRPRRFASGRWASRVRGLPEVIGELPVATLAEEIETPGEGQVRALFTITGNPCLSTPNAGAAGRARSRASSCWSASTSTSTRRRATPTSSCPARRRSSARTTTSRSTSSPCATWPTTRRPRCSSRRCRRSGRRCCG